MLSITSSLLKLSKTSPPWKTFQEVCACRQRVMHNQARPSLVCPMSNLTNAMDDVTKSELKSSIEIYDGLPFSLC
jgi:hypothetical protein